MAFVWVQWLLVIQTENWWVIFDFQTHCWCYLAYAVATFFTPTLVQGLNGHVGISTSEDDVDRVPLKISAQVISVAQDYFQHTQSEDKLHVANGGQ